MRLLDYLLTFKIKENFFCYTPHPHLSEKDWKDYGTYECKIGFYKDELGFISNNILSKIFLSKKFLSFKEVFPSDKKFSITIPSIHPIQKWDPVMEPFVFNGVSFEKAIDSRKKALVDLERLSKKDKEDNDNEYEKILKKHNLISLTNDGLNDENVRYFIEDYLYEVFFEHNYINFKLPKLPGFGPVINDNFFLVKKKSGKNATIFYLDTGNLMNVKDILIKEI
tara:strand:- start:203 stop:874 length:672 start_codon:yes stop_codon:yes gene_type:complete